MLTKEHFRISQSCRFFCFLFTIIRFGLEGAVGLNVEIQCILWFFFCFLRRSLLSEDNICLHYIVESNFFCTVPSVWLLLDCHAYYCIISRSVCHIHWICKLMLIPFSVEVTFTVFIDVIHIDVGCFWCTCSGLRWWGICFSLKVSSAFFFINDISYLHLEFFVHSLLCSIFSLLFSSLLPVLLHFILFFTASRIFIIFSLYCCVSLSNSILAS